MIIIIVIANIIVIVNKKTTTQSSSLWMMPWISEPLQSPFYLFQEPHVAEKNFTASVDIKGDGDLQVILDYTYNVRKDSSKCPFEVTVR